MTDLVDRHAVRVDITLIGSRPVVKNNLRTLPASGPDPMLTVRGSHVAQPCEAEITQEDVVIGRDEDVRALDIAVDNFLGMQVCYGLSCFCKLLYLLAAQRWKGTICSRIADDPLRNRTVGGKMAGHRIPQMVIRGRDA